jgi:hypothetical protein
MSAFEIFARIKQCIACNGPTLNIGKCILCVYKDEPSIEIKMEEPNVAKKTLKNSIRRHRKKKISDYVTRTAKNPVLYMPEFM